MQRSQGMGSFLQGDRDQRDQKDDVSSPTILHDMEASRTGTKTKHTNKNNIVRLFHGILTLIIAFIIGEMGSVVEAHVGIAGVSAGAITLLSLTVYGLCRRFIPRTFFTLARPAAPLSNFLFALFFAGIGAGASLRHLLLSGPVVFFLMALTLLVHLCTSVVGLKVYNRLLLQSEAREFKSHRIGVDEMVVASNANIGGPATAAAMAASIQRPDLVLPATITGTAGYALATFLGVAVYRSLIK